MGPRRGTGGGAARGDVTPLPIAAPAPGWHRVRLDPRTRFMALPRGTVLDIGAVGKAACADRIASLLHERLGGSFLVDLGGDLACGGPPPDGGWSVGVQSSDGHVAQTVASTGQALATSSTARRTWADGQRHHIIDPRSGRCADPVWRQVSCVGPSCAAANAASTAAIVLGSGAPAWLERRRVAARLERADGAVVLTGAWRAALDRTELAA